MTCVDKDPRRIADLKEGRVPIYEPGLEKLVIEGARQGQLHFSTELSEIVRAADDVVFITVGTPQCEDDGSADLSNVTEVARGIGRALSGAEKRTRPLVVANKSTVPVGSGDYVSMLVAEGAAEQGGSKGAEGDY